MSESWLIRLLCLISLVPVAASELAWSQSTIRTATELAEKFSDVDVHTDCAAEFPDLKFECENRVLDIKQDASNAQNSEAKAAREAAAEVAAKKKKEAEEANKPSYEEAFNDVFVIKDFNAGMTLKEMLDFAERHDGVHFEGPTTNLLEAGIKKIYVDPLISFLDSASGTLASTPTRTLDFDICSTLCFLTKAECQESYQKCQRERGERSSYTVAGLLLSKVRKSSSVSKMDGERAGWNQSCERVEISFAFEDQRDALSAQPVFFQALESRFGPPASRRPGNNHWRVGVGGGPGASWTRDYGFPYPSNKMHASSSNSSLNLNLSRCAYSEHQTTHQLDADDF